jgi:FkbM family methyltransferase
VLDSSIEFRRSASKRLWHFVSNVALTQPSIRSRLALIGPTVKTAYKISIARMMYRAVHAGRTLFGRHDQEIVVRDGVVYDLDLSQGIDFAMFLGGMFERNTALALRKLVEPSSLVLDIGANIGAHTLRLAKLVGPKGRVLAFEPTDFAFRKLKRNLSLNPELASRVDAFHCFLTDRDVAGVPDAIYSSWPLTGKLGLHAKHLGSEMRTEAAVARSLDSILSERPDLKVRLVKLDVDGFECGVLRGATRMLRETKPIFLMELAPYALEERGASLDEVLSYFLPNGYALFGERTEKPLPSNARELRRLIADGASLNVIARVPSKVATHHASALG